MAKKLSEEIQDTTVMGQVCLNLAILNQACCQLGFADSLDDNATTLYAQAFDYALQHDDWPTLLNSFANMASVATGHCPEPFKERIVKFGSLTLPDSIPGQHFYKERYNTAINIIDNDYQSAIQHIQGQIAEIDNVFEATNIKIQLYNELVHIYEKIGKLDSARYYNQSALAAAAANNTLYRSTMLYKDQSRLWESVDKVKSDYAKLKYHQTKDSLTANHNLMMIDNLETVSNIKHQNQELSIKTANQQRRLLIMCFLAALMLITIPMIVILHRRNRKLTESYRQLYDKQQEILQNWEHKRKSSQPFQPRHRILGENDSESIKEKIMDVMDTSEEIFSSDFSLDRLAELASVKPRLLSAVLNDVMHKSFYDFLNEYRVREACRRLEDIEKYGKLTIEAISQGLGYKSRTTLVNAFKKQTGLTPTEYQRISKQKLKETTDKTND